MSELILRKAEIHDSDFLVDIIVEAEKASTDILPYSAIFGLSEAEIRVLLKKMLAEEMNGCGELSISNYLLATIDDKIVAGSCAWIEELEGIPTNILKSNLLSYTLPKKAIERASKLNKLLNELHFDYIPDTIFNSVGYVVKEKRGNGILGLLKKQQIKNLLKLKPSIKEVYVDMFSSSKALRTNLKMGFEIVQEKESKSEEILNYLPTNKRILLRKKLK